MPTTDWLGSLDTSELEIATRALDLMSRPLTAREIEGALRRYGVSKSASAVLANAIRNLNIIAVIGPEDL